MSVSVASSEKEVETMPTQKIFKQRVRARMSKTGESYTTARRQLLRKAAEPVAAEPAPQSVVAEPVEAQTAEPAGGTPPSTAQDALVSDDSMQRATGRTHAEWFDLLDAWGATDHSHTEIARWLNGTQGVPGWWSQNVTVAYERARGMRARHQMRDGYSISVSRTIAVDPARALEAFTDARLRARWLPGVPLRQRQTRARLTKRFDWSDPASRLVVNVAPMGTDRTVVAIAHDKIPDAETAERLKVAWRDWLGALKATLERA